MGAKKLIILAMFLLVVLAAGSALALDVAEKKQTTLGMYVDARQAYAMWQKDPEGVHIIDCRTPEEYFFVGHAPMARNIPCKFFVPKVDDAGHYFLKKNPKFVDMVKAHYKPTDTILLMCQAGVRGSYSVNLLAKAGFTRVYNIVDGFEGDKVSDPASYFYGKREMNGWKNSGNPWTLDTDKELMYSK